MKFLKWLLIIILAFIAILFIISFFLPTEYDAEQSIVIDAKDKICFQEVANTKNWENWSPWQKMDSTMVTTYSAPFTGPGASFSWESSITGTGTLTFSDFIPYKELKTELNFNDMGSGQGHWTFEEKDDKTTVTWRFHSVVPDEILMKYLSIMMAGAMEASMADGLQSIKALAEAKTNDPDITLVSKVAEYPGAIIVAVLDSCKFEHMNIQKAYEKSFGELGQYIEQQQLQIVGPPISVNHVDGKDFTMFKFEAAFPIAAKPAEEPGGRVYVREIPASTVMKCEMTGDYVYMEQSYQSIHKNIKEFGYEITGYGWEEYLNDPHTVSPNELRTNIYFPIKKAQKQ